jgi:hypothetical protein
MLVNARPGKSSWQPDGDDTDNDPTEGLPKCEICFNRP